MTDSPKVERRQDEFSNFRIEYERRHNDLSERVTRLESIVLNVATKEDLVKLKNEILLAMQESVKVSTNVDWLTKAFWVTVGGLMTIGTGLAVHMLGIK